MAFCLFPGRSAAATTARPSPIYKLQVRRAFQNLNAILEAAGCTFDDVVDVTVFVVDPESNFETIWNIVPEYWGNAPYPTLTGVGVTWLYGFQFEIKVIAKLPEPALAEAQVEASMAPSPKAIAPHGLIAPDGVR